MKKAFGLALAATLAMTLPVMAAEKVDMKAAGKDMLNQVQTQLKNSAINALNGNTASSATMSRQQVAYSPEAQQQYIKGQSLLIEKRYPEAIDALQRAVSTEPDYTLARQALAQAFYARGEYEPALEQIQKALETDPLYTQLVLEKARILDIQKKEGGALEAYLTFLSINPSDSARLEIQRRATDLYDKWSPRMNEQQKSYYTGLRALSMDNPEQAISELKMFLDKSGQISNEQTINANRLLGLAYLETSRPTEAVATWEGITKLQPNNAVPYFHLSNVYEQTGRSAQAKQALDNFMKNAPKSQAYVQERYFYIIQPANTSAPINTTTPANTTTPGNTTTPANTTTPTSHTTTPTTMH